MYIDLCIALAIPIGPIAIASVILTFLVTTYNVEIAIASYLQNVAVKCKKELHFEM